MKPIQAAALFFRFFAIYMFILAGIAFTALPANIIGLIGSSDYLVKQRELAIVMDLMRIGVYSGAGVVFLLFTKPLAKLIAKGLENIESAD